jgi:dihydropyrimidine dehydrogenase (NAD+) subunit PreA
MEMIKELAKHPEIKNTPISGIGGVETWRDVVEFILLGASSVQVCTAAMHYGFGIVREMEAGLQQFMLDKGYNTIYDFVGKALPNVTEWKHLNLKHKVVAAINPDTCIGCDLCYTACDDGAHQAIKLDKTNGNRIPEIIEENCVGCNLCALVCPVEQCITMEKRDDGTEQITWNDRTIAGTIPTTFDDERAGGNHHFVPSVEDALKHRK